MSSIAHAAPVDYTSIHFAEHFPVTSTPCGKLGPSAAQWRYVDCLACLERAPDDPRIRERRRQVIEEAARRAEPPVAA